MELTIRWAPLTMMTWAILSAVAATLWSLAGNWERGLANTGIAILAYGFACIVHEMRRRRPHDQMD